MTSLPSGITASPDGLQQGPNDHIRQRPEVFPAAPNPNTEEACRRGRKQFVSEASALNTSGLLHPESTEADIQVVQRARHLLDSPAKWNRANTQNCPPDAKSFSLYCALATADKEVTGAFDDRCPAMREARHIIDEFGPNAKNYDSRLVDYNADPATSFAEIQRLLQEVQERLTKELTRESKGKKQ